MKKQSLVITMATFFSLSLSLAKAQYSPYYWVLPEGAGPYFRANIGPTIFQDGTLKGFTGTSPYFSGPQNAKVSYDVGASADLAFGYAFNKYFGLDFETGYVWTTLDNVNGYYVNNSTIANVPLLVNGTLSLPIPHTNIVPYIGGGVGGAVSEFHADDFSAQAGGSPVAEGDEDDAVFAYQGFAGVRFMINPNVSLGVGYKYFATGNPTFSYPPNPNLNIEFKGIQSHSILFTFQVNF
jgi:opacity protein-like surface antigen